MFGTRSVVRSAVILLYLPGTPVISVSQQVRMVIDGTIRSGGSSSSSYMNSIFHAESSMSALYRALHDTTTEE